MHSEFERIQSPISEYVKEETKQNDNDRDN